MRNFKLSLFTFLTLFAATYASGQLKIESFLLSGQSQIKSEGYMNIAVCPDYEINNWTFGAGAEFALLNPQNTMLNAWCLGAEKKLMLKNQELIISGDLFCSPFSEYIHELNLVFEIKTEFPHLKLMLGNNSRIYRLTAEALERWPGVDSAGANIKKEWRNFLYNFSYRIKADESKWNLGFGISNTSGFFFNQETTPMLFSRYENKLNESIQLFAECWFQQAGFANLQAQYFGFFVKGGLVWKSGK